MYMHSEIYKVFTPYFGSIFIVVNNLKKSISISKIIVEKEFVFTSEAIIHTHITTYTQIM